MVFECVISSIGCEVGKRYVGEIRNRFAINIKDGTGKIQAHDIAKFRIVSEEEEDTEE